MLAHPAGKLAELERLTAFREFAAAIELGESLVTMRWNAHDAALVHFHLGQAYCMHVRPKEALAHLMPARKRFEREHDEWMSVEALDWEASAVGLLDDPRGIELEFEALERCRRLDPPTPQLEARILGHLGIMFAMAHSWALAIRHYEAAIEAARGVRDIQQVAWMHHGLGTAYQRFDEPAKARSQFEKALELYALEPDPRFIYRVENDLGFLLIETGHLDAAEQHLLTALAGADELQMERRGRGFILANLGDLNTRRGRFEEARKYLSQAAEIATACGERVVVADVQMLMGKLEERLGDTRSADDDFAQAIDALAELKMPNRLRECHAAYADLLEKRGDFAAAFRQMKAAVAISKQEALAPSSYVYAEGPNS